MGTNNGGTQKIGLYVDTNRNVYLNGLTTFLQSIGNSSTIIQTPNLTSNNNSTSITLQTGSTNSATTGLSSGALNLYSGNGLGTNSSSGNIVVKTGSKTGTGTWEL